MSQPKIYPLGCSERIGRVTPSRDNLGNLPQSRVQNVNQKKGNHAPLPRKGKCKAVLRDRDRDGVSTHFFDDS
ncbi:MULTISPECIES: hypothetical protein [Spirulina sp. CCY15215]|uniref:hypothetical protein n=1 Tax=Spirulina sp. CCY15215 TaxID=2767591 RepID=UPI00194FD4F8|nr:hypothetical protein [Spirulina major]